MRQVALPTTYAGSEMTTIWGLTDGGHKRTGKDRRVKPEVVVYDPELTLTLPPAIAGPSGMNALAHCVEALYGPGANPVVSLMALEGIRALHSSLPAVCATPGDLAARTDALYGAYLAGVALASGGTALHHKACHVLGGMFGLDHGWMNAVVLGHTLAYNAPAIPEVMADIETTLGTDDAPGALFDLAAAIGAPTSLAAIGMPADGARRGGRADRGRGRRQRAAGGAGGDPAAARRRLQRAPAGGRGQAGRRRTGVQPRRLADTRGTDDWTGQDGRAAPSRRRFLQGMAALGVGGSVLAACGDDDDDGDDAGRRRRGREGDDIPSARIGYVTPRTGPLAPFGEADAFVLAAMRAELGEAVEIIDVDSESDAGRAGEVAQELISEGVELVLVSSTPDTTVPVASACDLGEVPCISTVAPWQPHYLGLGGELGPDVDEPAQASAYNWHFFWGLEDVIENFIALWEQAGAPRSSGGCGPTTPTATPGATRRSASHRRSRPPGSRWSTRAGSPSTPRTSAPRSASSGRTGVTIVSGVVPPPTFANFQSQALSRASTRR